MYAVKDDTKTKYNIVLYIKSYFLGMGVGLSEPYNPINCGPMTTRLAKTIQVGPERVQTVISILLSYHVDSSLAAIKIKLSAYSNSRGKPARSSVEIISITLLTNS